MLLALDASTTATGYAFGGPNDGSPRGGVWKLPGADGDAIDMTCTRLGRSIMELGRLIKVTCIAVEAPIFMGQGSNAHTIGALMQVTGAIRLAAGLLDCSLKLYAVSTCRKTFIGKGNLKKVEAEEAVQARCKLLGWAFSDHNHADANAVWAHGMSVAYPTWAPMGTPLFGKVAA